MTRARTCVCNARWCSCSTILKEPLGTAVTGHSRSGEMLLALQLPDTYALKRCFGHCSYLILMLWRGPSCISDTVGRRSEEVLRSLQTPEEDALKRSFVHCRHLRKTMFVTHHKLFQWMFCVHLLLYKEYSITFYKSFGILYITVTLLVKCE